MGWELQGLVIVCPVEKGMLHRLFRAVAAPDLQARAAWMSSQLFASRGVVSIGRSMDVLPARESTRLPPLNPPHTNAQQGRSRT